MKKQLLFSLLLLFCCSGLLAQNAPAIEWQKSLGGSNWDDAWSIQRTTDDGFIVAGYSESNDGDVSGNHGYNDYWIVKLDSSGNIQWQKSLGGSDYDYAKSIQQTADGGFIVAGSSESNDGDVTSNHGGNDYWIVKLNSSGSIEWQKSLGGSSGDYAYSIQQTTDGGFVVAGSSSSNDGDVSGNHGGSDDWIVKLDSSGNIQWQKCLGGSSDEGASSVQQTSDGGFIVVGSSSSNDGDVTSNYGWIDYWIVKLNSSGSIEWQKSLGGSSYDQALSIQQTIQGGFTIAGTSQSNDGDITGNHGSADYWIVKLDSSENIQWEKSLGGSDYDGATSIQQTIDGKFIVAGYSYSIDGDVLGNHGSYDCWIVKLDSPGNIQWQNSLGGSDDDVAHSIQQTTDGGFIVAGYSKSNDGDVSDNHGLGDFWIVKLSPEIPVGLPSVAGAGLFSVYPNPTNNNITITATFTTPQSLLIKLTDIIGREVLSFDEGLVSGNLTAQYDLSALSSGTYFLKMIHDGTSEVVKLQIEK